MFPFEAGALLATLPLYSDYLLSAAVAAADSAAVAAVPKISLNKGCTVYTTFA